METSLEIAQAATLRPIGEIAAGLGLEPDEIESYGRDKAKVALSVLDRLADVPDGKLIAVTAVTPTPKGEGKTTTSVALTQGLARIGRRPVLCLREASLGPVFGVKGGAAGGGYSQVVPMEELNLHFTGDLHAITSANNLLAAMIDAHLLHGNEAGIDPLAITWRRCLDMNDRALRDTVIGPRRQDERLSATERIRHHGGLGDDGDRRDVARPRRPPPPARGDHDRRDARGHAGDRRGRSEPRARWR